MNTNGDFERYIPNIISDMADLYQDNLIDDEYVSPEIVYELGDLFEGIPVELRAIGFRAFMEELDRRGVKYTLEIFKGDA